MANEKMVVVYGMRVPESYLPLLVPQNRYAPNPNVTFSRMVRSEMDGIITDLRRRDDLWQTVNRRGDF